MKLRTATSAARATTSLFASALLALGCQGPLVGGACLDGYEDVEGTCVAIEPDGGNANGAGGGGAGDGAGGDDRAVSTGTSTPDSSTGTSGGIECEGGEVVCGDSCVDLASDADACGACGVVCPSGICVDGRCEGDYAGHVVLCGFDQRALSALAPATIVGNAIFAWPADPVRVGALRVDRGTGPAPLSSAVTSEAAQRGRAASVEWFTESAVMGDRVATTTLDVAVVPELPRDPDAAAGIGTDLREAIASLTARGGIFVLLAQGDHQAVASFVEAAGIADDLVATSAANGPVDVVAFDDLLAVGVPTPFAQPASSMSFEAGDFDGRGVVSDATGRAIVLHGVVEPAGDTP